MDKFKFKEINLLQTIKLIGGLGNSTSAGIDNIDALAIKAAAVHLAHPLMHLVNTSLKNSKFASRWKISKLLPLLKSPELNKLSPSSFRPIAILPTISKLVEKVAQSQILSYLEENDMINSTSHAYRSGYSTTSALLELSEELYKGADEKKVLVIMTLDQSAAFDCVQHQLLMDKLAMYNMDDTVLKWVSSYLSHQSQFVSVGTAKSTIHSMKRGVPQGSVLGPLLFSVFTNELSTVIKDPDCPNTRHQDNSKLFGINCDLCGKNFQYADDTTYHFASKSRDKNQKKLVHNLHKLADFLTANQLAINMDKTHIEEVMIKQKRGRLPGIPPSLQVTNAKSEPEIINTAGHCRILGLNVQANLTWTSHLESGPKPLLPSLRRNIGALKNLSKLVPFSSRNTIARGLIQSRLSYLLIRKAQTTQNIAARWVSGQSRTTRISTLLETTGWFSIREMAKLSTATILWKVINYRTPRNLHDSLNWDNQTLEFETTEPRINFTKSSFKYRACRDWNEIPIVIRTISNISNFKKHMKTWMKSTRPRMPD